jgi:hypothetical protein
MENIVLGIEPTEVMSHYLVVTNEVANRRFLVGADTRVIGDEPQFYSLIENFVKFSYPDYRFEGRSDDRPKFSDRPHLVNALNNAAMFGLEFGLMGAGVCVSRTKVGGGYYKFMGDRLLLLTKDPNESQGFGSFDSVPREVLAEFERPILDYCAKNGININRVLLC